MKKSATLLFTAATLLFAAVPLRAQERPEMDFVRALRENNHGDLALDYLDRLAADKTIAPEIRAVVPLEKARTQMFRATREFNSAKRQALYKQATAEFDSFIKAKPKDPYAAEARFEMARIQAMLGRAQLLKAQRTTEDGAQGPEFEKAHTLLIHAKADLKDALAELDRQLANTIPPAAEKALTLDKLQCKLELQITQLDIAATYEPLNKNREDQSQLVKDAITELGKIFAIDAKNAICWDAKAWAGKGFLDIDDPKKAEKEFTDVLAENGAHAAAAHRLVRFFQFMDKVDPRKAKLTDSDAIIKMGEDWVRQFPAYLRTPEGLLLRFELAKTYQNLGKAQIKDPKAPLDAKAKDLLQKAVDHYEELSRVDSEFGDEVQQNKMSIILLTSGNITNTKSLGTFSDAYNAMQGLAAQLGRTDKADERKQLLGKILEVLNRADDLIDAKVPEDKAAEVRGNRAWAYMMTGDPLTAVIYGEHLAESMPHVPKAAAGGAYALQAYARMIGDAAADPRSIQTDTDRMYRLALYMEKNWPTDVNTDSARHLVGSMLLRPPKPSPKEAAAILGRISDAYKPAGALVDARWWWADAARKMLSEPNLNDKEKAAYKAQILKALEGVPEIGNNESADVAQMYVQSRLMLGQFLFENKKYDQMQTLSNTLKKRLPELKNLDANFKKDLQKAVDSLVYYSQFGRAIAELHAGNAVGARKIADPVLTLVSAQVDLLKKEEADAKKAYDAAETAAKVAGADKEKKQQDADDAKERAERVSRSLANSAGLMRGLTIVAMRAAILDDNGRARALQLLRTLQAIAAEEEKAPEGHVGKPIYRQIIEEITFQIHELKQGLPKTKPQLDKATASFSMFLDDVAKQPLTPQIIFFLSGAYSRLDKHAEAGKLLAKIPPPSKDASDKEQRHYKQAQLMALQELRLGKEFDAALKKLNEILKTDWGGKTMQVDEEKANLYMDWSKFGAAAVAWKDLMGKLLPSVQKDPRSKEKYYSAYYNYIFCRYKYAVSQDDPKKKQDNIVLTAKAIVKLEETQADFGGEGMEAKYRQLMNQEPTLKAEYNKAKAAAPPPAPAPGNAGK